MINSMGSTVEDSKSSRSTNLRLDSSVDSPFVPSAPSIAVSPTSSPPKCAFSNCDDLWNNKDFCAMTSREKMIHINKLNLHDQLLENILSMHSMSIDEMFDLWIHLKRNPSQTFDTEEDEQDNSRNQK